MNSEDLKLYGIAAIIICIYVFLRAWISVKLARTQEIRISPSQLKLIVAQGRNGRKKLRIFFVERGSSQFHSTELDFGNCKITLSADYNAAPYIKLSESGLHEKSAELYLPENTEIQYD